jgi:hypothetical protein
MGRINEEGKGGWHNFYTCVNTEACWSYFNKEDGVGERIMEGMNQTELKYMYIWKYHNERPI